LSFAVFEILRKLLCGIFAAENENKSAAKFPAKNQQVISL
jgi:hypothetical protein